MTKINDTTKAEERIRNTVTARIVADCPSCGEECEIDNLENHSFKGESEHCCMKCGNHLYFTA